MLLSSKWLRVGFVMMKGDIGKGEWKQKSQEVVTSWLLELYAFICMTANAASRS